MAADGQPGGRLREYLRQLPPGSRSSLIKELERTLLRGDDLPGGDVLLQELRGAVRVAHADPAPPNAAPVPRNADPARLFFRPVEPFVVDDDPARKHLGRIARSSLDPIWAFVSRDLVPAEAAAYCEEAARAAAGGNSATVEPLARTLHDRAAARLRESLEEAQSDDRTRRRLIGQVGTPRALDELRDLMRLLSFRYALDAIAAHLPRHVRDFAGEDIENVKALLDSPIGLKGDMLPFGLVLVMGRLGAPWQLIRIAIASAESDDAVRVGGSPYGVAITIVLADVERMVGTLKTDLKRGAAATALLKGIHDAIRGLRTELDLSGDTPWARQLAAIRGEAARVLGAQLESMTARVRRLIRPRSASEVGTRAALDAGDVAETETLIELAGACRNYAGELAVNEVALRTHHELQQYLDSGTKALLDALRSAAPGERNFLQSQADAAVRFCARTFGQEYASLLAKAADVAVKTADAAAAGEHNPARS
jgi:hypothetical protein